MHEMSKTGDDSIFAIGIQRVLPAAAYNSAKECLLKRKRV